MKGQGFESPAIKDLSNKTVIEPFAPFLLRNYRRLWPGDLLTSWAFEMENIVLGWYILVESGSVLLLTVFGSLLYLGTLVSPVFGVLGDRMGHRNLLCLMRGVYILLSLLLLFLAFADSLDPIVVLQISALTGIVRPSDLAIRGALVTEIVQPRQLTSALSISRTTTDSARIAGALTGASVFAVVGLQYAYIIVVCLYLAGLLLTLSVGSSKYSETEESLSSMPRATSWRDFLGGMSYVWRTPHILAAMWVAFVVNLTAFPFCIGLLPYVAKEIYSADQTGLGYIAASFALGALLGSLMLSVIGNRIRPARMMIIFAVIWNLLIAVFGMTDGLMSGIFVLVLSGLAQSLSLLPLAVMLMRTSDRKYRGLVMGVRMLAIYGLPVGLLIAGALISHFGFRFTALLYGVVGVSSILAIVIISRRHIWSLNAEANST